MQVPRGTRDFNPSDVYLRKELFERIKNVLICYGGVPIETPVIENMETVKNLYGEEFQKLVYTLDDDKLLLRYDLTVPLARYIANNGIINGKFYRVGKVYRKDVPRISKGRYCEFYQYDFDIIGPHIGLMIQEAEILTLTNKIMNNLLGSGNFTILINDRRILKHTLVTCGLDPELFKCVCSTLDKMSKISTDEMTEELAIKGVSGDVIMKILEFVELFQEVRPTIETLQLLTDNGFIQDEVKEELTKLISYINFQVQFTPTLARGLDYYTGLIYEVVYNDKNIMESSIAAGGRYDEMLGKLSNKVAIPAIGISFGIERICTILEKVDGNISPSIKVYIATIGKDMVKHRIDLCLELRDLSVPTEMSYSRKPKMRRQLDYVFKHNIPYMIVIGSTEVENGTVQMKNIKKKTQAEMSRKDAIKFLQDVSSY